MSRVYISINRVKFLHSVQKWRFGFSRCKSLDISRPSRKYTDRYQRTMADPYFIIRHGNIRLSYSAKRRVVTISIKRASYTSYIAGGNDYRSVRSITIVFNFNHGYLASASGQKSRNQQRTSQHVTCVIGLLPNQQTGPSARRKARAF